jgi:manganese-dependent ADP-ribose/CDP-alcohol diphosphatase
MGFLKSVTMGVMLPGVFSFQVGLIADVQYARSKDEMNFQRTQLRRYRQSLDIFKSAVTHWNTLSDIKCCISLGDQIDGKTKAESNTKECLEDFLDVASGCSSSIHYCYGNHDFYCFEREELLTYLNKGEETHRNKLYYHFTPAPGWRFIILDGYDISIIGASSVENKLLAEEILKKNNPNDLSASGGWFTNLGPAQMRYVPYNGGISREQLIWLENILEYSQGELFTFYFDLTPCSISTLPPNEISPKRESGNILPPTM